LAGAEQVVDGRAAELEAGHHLGHREQIQRRCRLRVEDGGRGARPSAAPSGRELPFQFLAMPAWAARRAAPEPRPEPRYPRFPPTRVVVGSSPICRHGNVDPLGEVTHR
jgi:hypothetical protein